MLIPQRLLKFFHKLLISLRKENDNGIYDPMNIGIKYAKGDWVYFMVGLARFIILVVELEPIIRKF